MKKYRVIVTDAQSGSRLLEMEADVFRTLRSDAGVESMVVGDPAHAMKEKLDVAAGLFRGAKVNLEEAIATLEAR